MGDEEDELHHLDYRFPVGASGGDKFRMRLSYWQSTAWQRAQIDMDPHEAMAFFRHGLAAVMARNPHLDVGDLNGEVERARRLLEGDHGA